MLNCAIYPRKSKASDNSDSMEVQITACIQYLDGKYGAGNYTYTVYDGDYDITGHSTKNRKDFQRMMDDIRKGKIQLVVIMRYDRIARNMRDFCNLYHDMEEKGCNLVSVRQQIDTSTPYGKNFMYQMASMAELEWAIISERYKDTAKYKREHGFAYTGRVPFGYMILKTEDGKRVVKDPNRDAMVVFNHYKKYKSKIKTVEYIRQNYCESFTYDILRDMIECDMYTGKVNGNDSFCEPYLTEKELDEIRSIKVIKVAPSKRIYTLSRLIECPYCHNTMQATYGGKNMALQYYRCGYVRHIRVHDYLLVRETDIEKQLLTHLEPILGKKIISMQLSTNANKKSVNEQIKAIQKRIDRLNYMFENDRISVEEYDKKYNALNDELSSIKQEETVDYVAIQSSLSEGWKDLYRQLDAEHKRTFWNNIISRIIIDKDKNIVDIIFLETN